MANVEPQSPEWYRQVLTAAELRQYELIRRGKDVPASLSREIDRLRELVTSGEADIVLTDVQSGCVE